MQRNLLLVASEDQLALMRESLVHMHAEVSRDRHVERYRIPHKNFGELELLLYLYPSLDAVTPHLRRYPVDLLLYDERKGGLDAVVAMSKLQADVQALAELWGPDFHFPMGRTVVILEDRKDSAHRTFILGREQVRDVLVAPESFARILRFLGKLLVADLRQNQQKIGCALSGGGLEGFLYQVGCTYALETSLKGRSFRDCDLYSGVSSGSIVATILANKIPMEEIVASLFGKSDRLPQMKGSSLYDFAGKEIITRITKESLRWSGLDPYQWAQKFFRSIPTGFFKGDHLREYIANAIIEFGGDDSFTSLKTELIIGATCQDTFEHVIFGPPPWQSAKISDAVRASCALPPVFTPHTIAGRNYIDGQITRTCNLEWMVKRGCSLIFIIDPLKPYYTNSEEGMDALGGIFNLIQTIKTLVYTRFQTALAHLTERYPDVDFLVFQPYDECAQLMAGSPMKYKFNMDIIRQSYVGTLRKLRIRHPVYASRLAKHGFHLISEKELFEKEKASLDF